MFEKRYTPFYGPSQLPLRLRVDVEDGWLNGAWSVYNFDRFFDRRLRIIKDLFQRMASMKKQPILEETMFLNTSL